MPNARVAAQMPASDALHAAPGALLWVRGLAAQRGDRLLFERLDLEIARSEVVWLRGRNGRGKTTLLRILAGLSTPAAGAVLIGGLELRTEAATCRASMGYVAHANALKDDLTATQALAFIAGLRAGPPDDTVIIAALSRLGVGSRAHALVRTLSQGQRRRVALARLALPDSPPLWLLDEPFDALDDRGIEILNALLTEHTRRGGAALLTSHQPLSLRQPLPREVWLGPPPAAAAGAPVDASVARPRDTAAAPSPRPEPAA
jgi:heme exporter protein A